MRSVLDSLQQLRLPSNAISSFVEKIGAFRRRFGGPEDIEDLVFLSLVGVGVGILAGLLVICLRMAIDLGSEYLFGIKTGEFEELPSTLHFMLPIVGVGLIYLLVLGFGSQSASVGVVHVIEQLSTKAIHMPFRNAIFQFLGACVALLCGLSGGREGPSVHLRAYAGSWIANRLRFSHNGKRVLVACGVAAAIASAFNLPLTGIVFAMEVVLLEYSIVGFLPVILASFAAVSILKMTLGTGSVFDVQIDPLVSFLEYPYIIFISILFGLIGVALKILTSYFASLNISQIWVKLAAAGVVTGLIGFWVPQVLGMSYDTIDRMFSDTAAISIWLLIALLVAKVFATSVCVGLRLPVGIIGPTIVVGFLAGQIFGLTGAQLVAPTEVSDNSLYALLGSASIFAVVLNAPLTAILTTMELTATHQFVVPSLLSIVTATLTSYLIKGRRSIFIETLISLGISYPPHPFTQYLRCTTVRAVMNPNVFVFDANPSSTIADLNRNLESLLRRSATSIEWLVIRSDDNSFLCPGDALRESATTTQELQSATILNLPGIKFFATIESRESLEDALLQLNNDELDSLCVVNKRGGHDQVIGVLTAKDIDKLTSSTNNQHAPHEQT